MSSRLVICEGKSHQLAPSGDRNIGPKLTRAYCEEEGAKSNEYLSPACWPELHKERPHGDPPSIERKQTNGDKKFTLLFISNHPDPGHTRKYLATLQLCKLGRWVEALMLLTSLAPPYGAQDHRILEGPSSSHEDRTMGFPATNSNENF